MEALPDHWENYTMCLKMSKDIKTITLSKLYGMMLNHEQHKTLKSNFIRYTKDVKSTSLALISNFPQPSNPVSTVTITKIEDSDSDHVSDTETELNESLALLSKHFKKFGRKRNFRKSKPLSLTNKAETPSGDKTSATCFKCQGKGHYATECKYKKNQFAESSSPVSNEDKYWKLKAKYRKLKYQQKGKGLIAEGKGWDDSSDDSSVEEDTTEATCLMAIIEEAEPVLMAQFEDIPEECPATPTSSSLPPFQVSTASPSDTMSAMDALTIDLHNALNGKSSAEKINLDLRTELKECYEKLKELAIYEASYKDQVHVNQILCLEREQVIAEKEKVLAELYSEKTPKVLGGGPPRSGKLKTEQNPVPRLKVDIISKPEEKTQIPPQTAEKGFLGQGTTHLRFKHPKGSLSKAKTFRSCYHCGHNDHIASNCPNATKAEKAAKVKKGPKAEKSVKGKNHLIPDASSITDPINSKKSEMTDVIASTSNAMIIYVPDESSTADSTGLNFMWGKGIWYLDSGCSKHITGNKHVLVDFKDEAGPSVKFGGEGRGITKGYGTLTNGKTTFKKVSYVEGLTQNLLSISQLCDKDHKLSFSKKDCKVKNRHKKVILRGQRFRDVYTINMDTSTENVCFMSRASSDINWLWRKHLSHLNFKTINQLSISNLVDGLLEKSFAKESICSACEKGKQTRASFKSNQVSTIFSPLQLLHMDLFGPVNIQSIGGKRYTLLAIERGPTDTAKGDLEKFSKSSKALESIIRAQVNDDLKRGIGYNNTPPPYNQNYIPPTTDLDRMDREDPKEGLDRVDPVDTEEESDEKSSTETIPEENHILTNKKGGMSFFPSKKVENSRKEKGKEIMSSRKDKGEKKTYRKDKKDHFTQKTVVGPSTSSQSQNKGQPRGNKRNWNNQWAKSHGVDLSKINRPKPRFIYCKLNHLAKDCYFNPIHQRNIFQRSNSAWIGRKQQQSSAKRFELANKRFVPHQNRPTQPKRKVQKKKVEKKSVKMVTKWVPKAVVSDTAASVEVNNTVSNSSNSDSNTPKVNTAACPTKRKPIIVTKYSSHEIPSKAYLLKLNRLTESNQGRRSSLWHVDSGCSRHMTGSVWYADKIGQDRTGLDSTGQDKRVGQDWTGQDWTGQDKCLFCVWYA
ncbi:hypothetical protein OSB04_002503 [Centaurea solstitialis]|uniref:CCHC-type domain-containing protein n=1 Tax=Centaurea solstitialis TaxID=347529 RepID=A0AA38WMF1_9ASTR|nr:hypothetical protein OSB04_002503 [Centaurea solstitialis]